MNSYIPLGPYSQSYSNKENKSTFNVSHKTKYAGKPVIINKS